jgi:hypothetical protein
MTSRYDSDEEESYIITNTPDIFVPTLKKEGCKKSHQYLHPRPLPLHKFREPSRINYFPQYVMHVDIFFSIYRNPTSIFLSWRQLLDMSLITIMDAEKQKKDNASILFVSHEYVQSLTYSTHTHTHIHTHKTHINKSNTQPDGDPDHIQILKEFN